MCVVSVAIETTGNMIYFVISYNRYLDLSLNHSTLRGFLFLKHSCILYVNFSISSCFLSYPVQYIWLYISAHSLYVYALGPIRNNLKSFKVLQSNSISICKINGLYAHTDWSIGVERVLWHGEALICFRLCLKPNSIRTCWCSHLYNRTCWKAFN